MKTIEQKIGKFVRKLAEKNVFIVDRTKGKAFPNVLVFKFYDCNAKAHHICLDESKFTNYKVKAIIDFVSKQYQLF